VASDDLRDALSVIFGLSELKECAFSPASQAVDLDSWEAKKVVFQATRVAYSVLELHEIINLATSLEHLCDS
ncbi:hypothetical protein Tco_1226743, partial [Tanacetum coccineum]